MAQITAPQTKLISAAELWEMDAPAARYELIHGELVEMTPLGGTHGSVAPRLGARLLNFVANKKIGAVMVESGYRLAANPDTVRSPDVSFLAAAQIPAEGLPDGFFEGAPALAVEMVSPNDRAADIQAKVQDYLRHGSQLVWVVYPRQKSVTVYHPDGAARSLQADDTLSGEDVLADFSCPVADLFG